jgi:hypothetical protein
MVEKRVVLEIPGMQELPVRRGVPYLDALTMDLYLPPDHASGPKPAVVIALGYPDVGVKSPFGCQFREMGMIVSWAQLFAASGFVGVVYETSNPAIDLGSVLSSLRANASELGIDAERLGVWAASGNAPVALSALMSGGLRCGVLCYSFTLDLDGSSGVAEGARTWHFANPTAGRSVQDIPAGTALFLVRAGKEQFAGVNDAMDAFATAALRCNLPVTLVNHPDGQHGFDLIDDTEATRALIRAILLFLRERLA